MSDSLKTEIKQALVRSLRLPMPAEDITDDLPLFGEGLGLDSIDALELVLEVERTFGVVIDSEKTGFTAFRSVNTLAEFIESQRAAKSS
ncbi:MAG: phosphopantetheine-binding protein [Vicinamibacterales bacterium]